MAVECPKYQIYETFLSGIYLLIGLLVMQSSLCLDISTLISFLWDPLNLP